MKNMTQILFAALFCLSGCASELSSLKGNYKTINTIRSSTLKISEKNRYEFCYQKCSTGTFKIRKIENGSGRINFFGSSVEEYVRKIKIDKYGDDSLNGRNKYGSVELNYEIDHLFGTAIYIDGGSDVMFVKN
jgi:hypothetical protein